MFWIKDYIHRLSLLISKYAVNVGLIYEVSNTILMHKNIYEYKTTVYVNIDGRFGRNDRI